MRSRASTSLLACAAVAACAGGAPSLGYSVPEMPSLRYVVGDTVTIALQMPGQALEIALRSAATYDVRHERSSPGVRMTAGIEGLAADVSMPMAEALSMDETALEGDFVFELDPRGHISSMSAPRGSSVGAQVFAAGAPLIAHALVPRLPGRVASSGDSWVDSVTYQNVDDAGESEITSILTYTVVGDAELSGRTLTEIDFEGSAHVTQDLSLEGATVTQESELEVTGRLRWDVAAGALHDSELTMEGPGTVRIALLPAALPTRVSWSTRVQLDQ